MREERVNPIRITDKDTGEVYELDFSRESVMFADQQGFKIDEVTDFPATNFPKFFYLSLRKNHRKLSRGQADKLYEKLGGMSPKLLERLILLYNQAMMANNLQDDEDLEKNGNMTVEF